MTHEIAQWILHISAVLNTNGGSIFYKLCQDKSKFTIASAVIVYYLKWILGESICWKGANLYPVVAVYELSENVAEQEVFVADGSSSQQTESRKKGNRSKNAYMLVYQKKTFIQATKGKLSG